MNGIEAFNTIKQSYQKIQSEREDLNIIEPICIFLTAFATTNFTKHLKQIGVDHVYEKPISKQILK